MEKQPLGADIQLLILYIFRYPVACGTAAEAFIEVKI